MKYIKKFEGFGYSDDDFRNEVLRIFKQYDMRPVEINKLLDFYQEQMFEYEDSGKTPQNFVDSIKKNNDIGPPGGNYMNIRTPRHFFTNSLINNL